MTKQIVAILLTAAIAAATITACGKTAESPETTAVTVEETETKTNRNGSRDNCGGDKIFIFL